MADINITVDSSQIVRARSELDSLGLTVLKQAQTIQRLERHYKQLDRAFNTGKLSAQQYAKGVKQLDAAIEGISKGSVRATNATQTLSKTQSSAAIAAQNLANAQRMSGKETNRFGMYAQQVGYQVGDFLVQVQSGTSALVAFGQQGTQLAGLLPGIYGALIGIGLSLTTALLSMGSATTELSFNFAKLWEDVKSAFEPMAPLFKAIGSVFKTVGSLIVDAINLIINSFAVLVNVVASIPEAFSVALDRAEMRIEQFSASVNSFVYSISANWQRMMDTISGSATPGFLSTVPGEKPATAVEDFEYLSQTATTQARQLGRVLEKGPGATSVLGDSITNTPNIDLRDYLSRGAKTSGGGGGGKDATESALDKLREQLALEKELIGTSESYQRVRQALGEDFINTNPKIIEGLIQQADEIKELTRLEEERQSLLDTVQGSLENGFMAMVKGTQTVGEAFKTMAAAVIEELFRVLVVQELVGKFDASAGTGSGIMGVIGKIFSPKLASGGSMMAGGSYLVGENGPELVVPRHSGTVVNANQTSGAMAGSGGITVQNNITVTGSDAAMVRQEVAKMIPQITNATKAAVIDAKQRGGQMAAAFGR
jgi:hypothetical protein